ncbi:MAG TPA: ring-opening amidohydrolase, partial [Burkholderiales bacterium]|nr:ring-opening amidohydrolase [Burkholderiales bacterium]
MQRVDVFKIPMSGPADVSGLERRIANGAIAPQDIVAIMGKTEGNGCVNDFTREYATATLAGFLGRHLKLAADEVEQRIAFVMSGGTEGVLSPHITVFTRMQSGVTPTGQKRLALGIAATREFLPEEIGRDAQIVETQKAVEVAMLDAEISNAADVHFVQIKCPLLTAERIRDARDRAQSVVTEDTYGSMGYSRGASALGVALALHEIDHRRIPAAKAVLHDWSQYSAVASTSAGIELMRNVIILMGNSRRSNSPYTIGHAVMQDAIDIEAV